MFFYFYIYITAFFFSIFSILAKSNFFTKMWIYFLFFLILIYVGLRDGLGSDWGSYSEMYAYSWKEKNIAIPDIGFNLISHFFYLLGAKFQYSVFFLTFVALVPILRLSRNYKYGVLVIFLYSFVYLTSLMGLMRQMIAISLCLFAAEKLYQKKNRQYFFYVLTAIFFHSSAAVFFLAYFVQKVKIGRWLIFFIAVGLIIINYLIVNKVGYFLIDNGIMAIKVKEYFILPDYNQYPPYYSSSWFNTMLMITQKLLFISIFSHYFTNIAYNHKGIFYLKIYSLSLLLNLMFIFSIPLLATRAAIYFSISEIFLLALLCQQTRYKWTCIFAVLLYGCVKYFKILLSLYLQMVPYKTILSLY